MWTLQIAMHCYITIMEKITKVVMNAEEKCREICLHQRNYYITRVTEKNVEKVEKNVKKVINTGRECYG